jgi:hypothetical protein
MNRRRIRLGSAACALLAAQAFLLSPALAGQGRLGGGEALDVSLGRIVAALVVSLIVAGLAILLIRQRGGRVDLHKLFGRLELRTRAIQVVETRRLSQHADLCLVRHRDTEFLLLLMAGDARVLREGPSPAAAAGEMR